MGKAKVLVVEDDVHLLEGIRDILELDGYAVLTAENGSLGMDVLHNQVSPPDLILSDIMMPRMDGIQFLKEVRKEQRWMTIPFIFLTAKGEKADQHRGLRLGVDDYVVKPYDPTDLLVKIETRLERHRHLADVHSNGMAALKRQILTMLNHEFRTPLTFVVAYSDMLNNPGLTDLSQDEMISFVKGVSSGADRLRNLVENFILLVELETNDAKQTYDWRKTQITEVHPLFENACARQKDLHLHPCHIEVGNEIPIFMGDAEYLTAAIAQLVNNAIKFSAPGKPITMGAAIERDQLSFWVKDEGRGIPRSEFENIWKSFYQINRAVNEDQGSGSGLAIVQGVANLHGGQTAVQSEVGVGSLFKIIIPLNH
jgi:two-component system, sensor histidine kinase and response regulator